MIEVLDDAGFGDENSARLEALLAKLADVLNLKNAGELCVRLVAQDEIQSLNRDYRGKDEPTDVLAFPSGGDDFPQPERILGDIALCPRFIQASATEREKPFETELYFALAHGILHLLGWRHDTDEALDGMNKKTIGVLAGCGVEVNDLG
jgi:probable rRNA maturation factor